MSRSSQINQARRLLTRLERLSADSIPAHRASGLRGSLLKYLDEYDRSEKIDSQMDSLSRLEELIQLGYEIIEDAARLM